MIIIIMIIMKIIITMIMILCPIYKQNTQCRI